MKSISTVPGCIYKNGARYWWKVVLPGETKARSMPLRPTGARFATKDKAVACEIAKMIYQKALKTGSREYRHSDRTIGALCARYLQYCQTYYQHSQEATNIEYGLRVLIEHYGTELGEDFNSIKLKQLRDKMIKRGWSRAVINKRISMVKRMFRWLAEEHLVPVHVFQGIQLVSGLAKGRSTARETEPIKPVPEKDVLVIIPYASKTVGVMLKLQLLTGMRSGELTALRPADIDRSGPIWSIRLAHHKTSYRGYERIIAIGPKAQKLLAPFLLRDADSFCFSPQDAETQRGRTPSKQVSQRYDSSSYRKAVNHAIRAARKDGIDIKPFSPHRIRHTVGTKIKQKYGLDAARVVLGHRSPAITEVYAELDANLAAKVAAEVG